MKVFITGASGFIGGAVVLSLKGEHSLAAMSRSAKSDEKIRALGIEPVRCDLETIGPDALRGIDAVIHCAAFVGEWGTREEFWKGNVVGTENMLRAAKEAGVKKFIHIGTEAAVFAGQHMREIDETYPYPISTPFLYSETKREAEKRVFAANVPGHFETISVRPRFVWGPGDETILPVLEKMVKKGDFIWIQGGTAVTDTTHVDNVAHGIKLALTRGQGGRAYFITDGIRSTFRDFLTQYLGTKGLVAPEKSIPGWTARTAAFLVEGFWKLFGIKKAPPLTRFAVAVMSSDCTIRIDRARSELGYEPVINVEQGFKDLAAAQKIA